ncbi:hypothetical protein B0H13DRAFT_1473605, partial [Mycena leptocephala]
MSESSSEQYAILLLPKCYGYPLWDPQPTESNTTYQKDGVRIGDVGYLSGEGSFNYLFNICVPKDDLLNAFLSAP